MMSKLIRPLDNYTMIDNAVITDKGLSLRAKGLYCLMFSKPDGWVFRPQVLMNESKEGRDAFNSAMQELVERGWVVKRPVRDNKGHFMHNDYELRISSNWKPVDGETVDGKTAPTNTIENKTDEIRPKESKKKEPKHGTTYQQHFGESEPVTCPAEFWNDAAKHGWGAERIENTFREFSDWHIGKGSVWKDWRAAFRTWCGKQRGFEQRGVSRGGPKRSGYVTALGAVVAERRGRGGCDGGEQGEKGDTDADAFSF